MERGLIINDTKDQAEIAWARYERLGHRPFSIFKMHDGSYGFMVT